MPGLRPLFKGITEKAPPIYGLKFRKPVNTLGNSPRMTYPSVSKHRFTISLWLSGILGIILLCATALDAQAQEGRYTSDVALSTVEADCEKNVAEACLVAFVRYFEGRGVPANPAKAEFYMKRSCLTGSGVACAAYATALELKASSKTEAGRREVIVYADKACAMGENDSCKQAARLKAAAKPTPAPAPAPKPKPAVVSMADRCNSGDAYACERHAWDMGQTGSWLIAAQFAKKGCDLGRSTSCTAASMYQTNYRNHGDQSDAGVAAWRQTIIDRAKQNGTYAREISNQLRNERDLATVAELIALGGPTALRQLTFDEVGDLAGQPWGQAYRQSGLYVQAEWQRRDGPAILAARKRKQSQPGGTQGVGKNENGTADCYVNGSPGKRYQYSGFDGKMVYGPCIAL